METIAINLRALCHEYKWKQNATLITCTYVNTYTLNSNNISDRCVLRCIKIRKQFSTTIATMHQSANNQYEKQIFYFILIIIWVVFSLEMSMHFSHRHFKSQSTSAIDSHDLINVRCNRSWNMGLLFPSLDNCA